MLVLLILFNSLWKLGLTEAEVSNTSSPILFTLVGQAALKTAYGHLLVPLDLPSIKKNFDQFNDLEEALNKLTTTTDSMSEHKNVELDNLRGKLDIVHHLALTKVKENHFKGFDTNNDFYEKLNQALGSNANQWKPGTPSTTTTSSTTTPSTLRIKRNILTAGGIFQLAGFDLSLFNRQELLNVRRAAESTETQHRYVVAQAGETLMRLSNLTDYTNRIYGHLLSIAKTQTDLYESKKREGIRNEVNQMKRMFISEFSIFLTGFQSLIEGRFSPLLVNPDLLQSTYDDIVTKSRQEHLHPISEDADIIFQSPTSVVGTEDGDLLAIIHIPMYSGSLMRMYRYVSAPFPLREEVVATIKHDKDYLALDPSGTVGKELSSTEVLSCDQINRIFHCTGENVLQKNLDDLCLYHLFNQRVDQIEEFCRVEIGKVKSHAIQLSGNQFRILVTEPTQLTKICLDGNTKVETIRGVYILTLSDTCPKANTPDHIFTRNPHVVSSQQLITLPSMQNAVQWFKTIDNSFSGTQLEPVLEEIKTIRDGPISIETFRKQIERKKTRFYKEIIDYVQLALTAVAVTYAIYLLLKVIRNRIFTRIPWCCTFCKKDKRVKQYVAVPRLAGQTIKPNAKARDLLNDRYAKVQPSAPPENINPV